MSDERLLAEALRAHAAGGVSTPFGAGAPTPSPSPAGDRGRAGSEPSATSRWTERFRPAGASATGSSPASVTGSAPAPGPPPAGPAPMPVPPPAGPLPPGVSGHAATAGRRPPTPPGSWSGPATPAGGRPVPMPPPGPGVPHPRAGAVGPAGPFGPGGAPGPRPPVPEPGPRPWTAVRVAWWSGVALLGGAVVGGLAAVVTLLVP